MKRFIIYYLKFFLLLFFIPLSIKFIFRLFGLNDQYGAFEEASSSFKLALVLTLILVTSHISLLKRRKIPFEDFESALKVSDEIVVSRNIEEIKSIISTDFISRFKKIFKKIKTNNNAYLIKTKMTIQSFGEQIDLRLEKLHQNETKIIISSKPVVKGTLIDYGKNKENIKKIEQYFLSELV